MSRKTIMIELEPPPYDNVTEFSTACNIPCPACNGSGKVIDWGVKEDRTIDCLRCKGTGRLRAKVAVEWEADTEITGGKKGWYD